MQDLNTGLQLLLDRRPHYDLAEAYYEGTVGEVMPRRIRRLAKDDYKVNFCRTIVDSVLNRLEIATVLGVDNNDTLGAVWERNELSLEANELHRRALVYGDAYAIVWPDADGELEISYNSPKNTVLVYDPESPRRKQYAVKVWVSTVAGKPGMRANVYYADRTEKYSARTDVLSENMQWQHTETVDNPYGQVPVFHFRTHRPYGRAEHYDVYGLQDAVTKTIANHMYTMDYQAAPQRYALSGSDASTEVDDFSEDDTARENVSALKNGPGELWYLKGVESVGQFPPADPQAFLEPVREYVRAMASTSSTPLHYFERTAMPSGEALRTAEAPLMKKVADRQLAFGSTWRELFSFVLAVEGAPSDVQVKWQQVESMDSLDFWDVILKKRNAGVPMQQVFLEAGYDEELVQQMLDWFEEEQQRLGDTTYVRQRKPQVRVDESTELSPNGQAS